MRNMEKIIRVKGRKFLLKVEDSAASGDYIKYENIRNEIWGFPEDSLPGSRNMLCENFLHEGSSLFIAIYAESERGSFIQDLDHMAGFSYGFVGVKDKDVAFKSLANLQFYSQYAGIKEEFRGYGLGVAVKEFQREKVRDVFGIFTITCTYDPLTGVNASRNVHHFGMEVEEYRVSTYGEYGGLLNRRDIPSDRFFMTWDLRRDLPKREYDVAALFLPHRRVADVEDEVIPGKSGPLELEVIRDVRLNLNERYLFFQIPLDYYLMLRETDVEEDGIRRIPLEWRLKTREAFLHLFGDGYKVIDFRQAGDRKKNYYILKKNKTDKGE